MSQVTAHAEYLLHVGLASRSLIVELSQYVNQQCRGITSETVLSDGSVSAHH